MVFAALAASLLLQAPPASNPPAAPPAEPARKPEKPAEPVKQEGAKKEGSGAKEASEAKAIPLFDGKSLAGWKVFAPEGSTSGLWTARDGVLACAGQPIGYIATEAEYESFELTLEWRFDPAKGAGNSGVLLRVQQPDQVWPTSIEAQLHSENAGDIWNIGAVPMTVDAKRTEGRRTVKLHPTNEKPLGEWNRYRIVLNGGTLELYVNDLLQNRATDVQVRPGRIALQSEGAAIEFRSIELRPLDVPATTSTKR